MDKLRTALIPLIPLFLTAAAFAAPSQPFDWTWSFGDDGLSIAVSVPDAHYLYAERTKVSVSVPGQGDVPAIRSPSGAAHNDELLGETQILEGGNPHSWLFPAASLKTPLKVELSWQGCKEKTAESPSLCFMPGNLERTFDSLQGSGSFRDDAKAKAPSKPLKSRKASGYIPEAEFISFLRGDEVTASKSDIFVGKGFLASLLIALLGGLALNLTPCVLPMIPINLAIIGAGSGESSKSVRIAKGAVYASGITLAYASLGVAAAIGGMSFGQVNSEWWFNLGASFIFLFLGLAMLGVFEIDLLRFGSNLKRPSAAGFAGIFAMGALSAVLAGACVAPVVIAVLLQAASLHSQGDVTGLLLPLALGVGMALPWPLAAAGLSVLPKPGPWMLRVKQALGVLIVLLAFHYAWTGGSMLVARVEGASSPERESAALERALAESKRSGKPLLIDFWASWCKSCKAMEETTLKSPAVRAELENFVFLKFRAEHPSNPETKAVLDSFGVAGLPSFVIVGPE